MVPLTSSLYVPGHLSNISTVLVDVGTGFYVEKQIPDARIFIAVRRIEEARAGTATRIARIERQHDA
jgi:prefoldin alpha subunit